MVKNIKKQVEYFLGLSNAAKEERMQVKNESFPLSKCIRIATPGIGNIHTLRRGKLVRS